MPFPPNVRKWSRRQNRGPFLPTHLTDPKDPQAVMGRLKAISRGNLVLFLLDHFAVEFDQLATIGTDQVVVMLMIELVFVPTPTVSQPFLACQTTLTQQFERSVDRRETDRGIFRLDPLVEIFRTEMALGLEKDVEDQIALAGPLVSSPSQMLEKDCPLLFKLFHRWFRRMMQAPGFPASQVVVSVEVQIDALILAPNPSSTKDGTSAANDSQPTRDTRGDDRR